MKGIQNCTNGGPGGLQRGDNHRRAKIGLIILKIFSRTTKPHIYTKASLYIANSSLYKLWCSRVGWGHNGENNFYMC
jgi:hypothetical protein